MSGGQIAAVAAMGSFHGLNPGMGWLFAVAIGFQERSRAALLRALPPIALGHALSIGAIAVVVAVTDSVLASRLVAIAGGVLLVGFGLWRMLAKRHLRWAGMRLNRRQLTLWSFLMSSVDGAGLMLLPLLIVHAPQTASGAMASMPGMADMPGMAPPPDHTALLLGAVGHAAAVTLIHTVAMIVVAGAIALFVYEVIGLRLLRTAWINLDRIWAFCLVGAGVTTVLLA
jgi:hypothetical protein